MTKFKPYQNPQDTDQDPKDPRVRHKKPRVRGSARIPITRVDIAEEFGCTMNTVYSYCNQFNSVSGFARLVATKKKGHSKPLAEEKAAQWVSKLYGPPEHWYNRWPRFELYDCAYGCGAVSFEKGVCPQCGGYLPTIKFNSQNHIAVRCGDRYKPMYRLLASEPEFNVSFINGNRWDLRLENLELNSNIDMMHMTNTTYRIQVVQKGLWRDLQRNRVFDPF